MMDTPTKSSPKRTPTQKLFELLKDTPMGESSNVADITALIANGADVNAVTTFGYTPLVMAATYGNAGMVTALVAARGILVNKAEPLGKTALMMAAASGHVESVKTLLAASSILVNKTDADKATALMHAAYNGRADIITLLLAVRGISVNQENFKGQTALLQAVKKGYNDAVIALLTAQPTDIDKAISVAEDNDFDEIVAVLKASKTSEHEGTLMADPISPPQQPEVTFRYTSITNEKKSPSFSISAPLDISLEGLQLDGRKTIKSPRCYKFY